MSADNNSLGIMLTPRSNTPAPSVPGGPVSPARTRATNPSTINTTSNPSSGTTRPTIPDVEKALRDALARRETKDAEFKAQLDEIDRRMDTLDEEFGIDTRSPEMSPPPPGSRGSNR